MDDQVQREMTYGEKLVGLNFNPSGDEDVNKVKKLLAEAIDIVRNRDNISEVHMTLKNRATNDLLEAQMMAVKAITWK